MINTFKRVQKGLKLQTLYPNNKGFCACGCNKPLTGRQARWASSDCSTRAYEQFSVVKGNVGMIRKLLYQKQVGFCQMCGVYSIKWEADHIKAVKDGGGASGIENFQTLCPSCHHSKHHPTQNSTLLLSPHKPLQSPLPCAYMLQMRSYMNSEKHLQISMH